jgi:hypothetical protein
MNSAKPKKHRHWDDRDTMRSAYDFSRAARRVTAARYAQGTNIVTVAPDVDDVFPNTSAATEALRPWLHFFGTSEPPLAEPSLARNARKSAARA